MFDVPRDIENVHKYFAHSIVLKIDNGNRTEHLSAAFLPFENPSLKTIQRISLQTKNKHVANSQSDLGSLCRHTTHL
jgi:hypothetical protein